MKLTHTQFLFLEKIKAVQESQSNYSSLRDIAVKDRGICGPGKALESLANT